MLLKYCLPLPGNLLLGTMKKLSWRTWRSCSSVSLRLWPLSSESSASSSNEGMLWKISSAGCSWPLSPSSSSSLEKAVGGSTIGNLLLFKQASKQANKLNNCFLCNKEIKLKLMMLRELLFPSRRVLVPWPPVSVQAALPFSHLGRRLHLQSLIWREAWPPHLQSRVEL